MINYDNFPPDPKALHQWVCFNYEERNGNRTKVLKIPGVFKNGIPVNAKANKPETWRTFDTALKALDTGKYDGMGFVLAAGNGLVGIDVDKCITDDGISANAQQIIEKFSNTYIEKSVSGTGIHIICKGNIHAYVPDDKTGTNTGKTKINGIEKIESYYERRFLTVTGDLISAANTVNDCQPALDWLYEKYPALNKRKKAAPVITRNVVTTQGVMSYDDYELIQAIKRSKHCSLFDGTAAGSYNNDESAMDQALMNVLPFYCRGDRETMRRIFSASAPGQREKWRTRTDYQNRTIDTALASWDGTCYDPAEYAKRMRAEEAKRIAAGWQLHLTQKLLEHLFYLPCTDAGNMERIETVHGNNWRFIPSLKKWRKWSGQRWMENSGAELVDMAINVFRMIGNQTDNLPVSEDPKTVETIAKFIHTSENLGKIRPALEILKAKLSADPGDFDSHTELLNMPDATYNLYTGESYLHERGDYLTQVTGCTASSSYVGSLWDRTVRTVIPDDVTRERLQRFCGYCLSGDVSEEVFLIAFGSGGRGKGTVFETIAAAMGDYATQIPVEVVLKGKNQSGNAPTPELAKLKGKRLVLCTESGTGKNFDEAKVKWLTGGDTITARPLYAEPISFKPTFKFIIQTNYLPHVSDPTDDGLRRRLLIINFDADISERDTTLKQRLRRPEELPNTMAWLLQGWQKYQSAGLGEPSETMMAVMDKYYADNDLIAQWISECCNVVLDGRTSISDAVASFNDWLSVGKSTNESWRRKDFNAAMEAHKFSKIRTAQGYAWQGIQLKSTQNEK